MSTIQSYLLHAAENQEAALQATLRQLAEHVRALEGCESVAIFHDVNHAAWFVFMETYADVAAHVPKPIPAEMLGLLRAKPEVRTLAPPIPN